MIYFVACNKIEKTTQDTSVLALDQAKSIYEQRINEISHMTYQLYTNSNALSFSYVAGGDNKQIYSKIIHTQYHLPNYSVTNSFILDYYILFSKTKMVANNRIIYNAKGFYDSFLRYSAMDYDTWLQKTMADSARGAYWQCQPVTLDRRYYGYLSDNKVEALTCLMNTGKKLQENMSVIMLVDAREMEKVISPVIHSSEDYACIIGKEGLIFDINPNAQYYSYIAGKLSQSGESLSGAYTDFIHGEKVFVTCIRSDELGWSLISIRPYNTVMSNLLAVQRAMIYTACVSIIAGIGLAMFFSLKKNAPAMSLFHDRERYQVQIEEQKPIIRSTFLERLFNGMLDNQQILMFLHYLGIPFGNFYTCFVFQFFDDERLSLEYFERIKLLINNFVSPLQELNFHDIGSYRLAFLLKCDREEDCRAAAEQMAGNIMKELHGKVTCKIAVAIAKPCAEIQRIPVSLNSAIMALNYKSWEDSYQVITAETVNPKSNHSLQNNDIILVLNQLDYCIKNGNSGEVERIFRKIESDIAGSDYTVTQNAINMVTYSILNLISGLLDAGYDTVSEKVKTNMQGLSQNASKNSPSDNIRSLRKICLELSNTIAAVNSGKNNEIIGDLLGYVDQNYCNPSLSLSMLSDKYAISEPYLSMLFKKYTNENISVYIENLRMSKARELLQNPRLSIQEITESIGYNSTNTFNKAFKKKYGVPPSACRNAH